MKSGEPIEVTETQYKCIMHQLSGYVFGRYDVDTKKYYIKIAMEKYVPDVESLLKQIK